MDWDIRTWEICWKWQRRIRLKVCQSGDMWRTHVSVTFISNLSVFRMCSVSAVALVAPPRLGQCVTVSVSNLVIFSSSGVKSWSVRSLSRWTLRRLSRTGKEQWQGDILEIGGFYLMFVWVCVCDSGLGVRQPEGLKEAGGMYLSTIPGCQSWLIADP